MVPEPLMTRVAQLIYPGDRYADLAARDLALAVLQEMVFGCGPGEIGWAAGAFMEHLGAAEGVASDLLDTVVSIEELQHVPLPPAIDDEQGRLSTAARVEYLHQLGLAIRDVAVANLATLKPEHARALESSVADRLGPPLGLNGARHFLAALAGRLASVRLGVGLDKQEFERQRAELAPRYAAAEVEALVTGNGAGRYRQLVDEEAVLVFDIERHEAALDLFTHLIDRVADWRGRVTALSSVCDSLIEELLGETERTRRRRLDLGPTAYEIDVPTRGVPRPDPQLEAERFVEWLASERQEAPASLLPLGRGELKDLLLRWADGHEAVRAIRERRIEDVLSAVPPDDRQRHLRQLVSLTNVSAEAAGKGNAAEDVYVFGVEDASRTSLTQEEIDALVPAGTTARLVSTADPRRLFCFGVRM
jgi:hypothetical protein